MRELTDDELEIVSGGGLGVILRLGVAMYLTGVLAVKTANWLLSS
jgi:hypothetical protein